MCGVSSPHTFAANKQRRGRNCLPFFREIYPITVFESDGTITGAEWLASDISDFTPYDDEDLQDSTDCGTGDVNGDGVNNILDVVIAVNHILGNTVLTEAQLCSVDMNEDGILNILDIVQLVNIILNN